MAVPATLLVLGFVYEFIDTYLVLGLAITGASTSYLIKDFVIRHSYIVNKESRALSINLAAAVTIALTLLCATAERIHLSAAAALAIYGGANLVAATLGLVLARLPIRLINREALCSDMREAWIGGRWYVLVSFTYPAQTQAHTVIGAALLGPAAVGVMNAARLFVAAPMLVFPALGQVLLPRMVSHKANPAFDLVRSGDFAATTMTAVSVAYVALLVPALDYLVPIVVGPQYRGIDPTIYAWCLALLVMAPRCGAALTSYADKKFRELFIASLAGAIASVIAGAILMRLLGTIGGPLGYATGELLLFIMIRCRVRAKRSARSHHTVETRQV